MTRPIPPLVSERLTDGRAGVTSVCTAHPVVIEAALSLALRTGNRVLIEATCNQVNQEGGYTGMTPARFRALVEEIAAKVGFDPGRLVLGGDHLGPNPWKGLPAQEAMARAEAMVADYAAAGFVKIHLDASMGCAGEPESVSGAVAAERAARLAAVAEAAAPPASLCYVVGTEVPAPGGVGEDLHVDVTEPRSARATIEAHEQAFRAKGLSSAFARVIALVVQPGVEFGASHVHRYDPSKARGLSAVLQDHPQFVFEAHSTDYQTQEALSALVRDGFAILKVGPALTFALREALYALDHIAEAMLGPDRIGPDGPGSLRAVMERVMTEDPRYWAGYYHGDAQEQELMRHFSQSDRIRYYWPKPEATTAVERLFSRLGGRDIPPPLISQYLNGLYLDVAKGLIRPRPRDLVIGAVSRVLSQYRQACA
jgi:D-tagatose-bisphosphate aldolase class II non-catalytic subunit